MDSWHLQKLWLGHKAYLAISKILRKQAELGKSQQSQNTLTLHSSSAMMKLHKVILREEFGFRGERLVNSKSKIRMVKEYVLKARAHE